MLNVVEDLCASGRVFLCENFAHFLIPPSFDFGKRVQFSRETTFYRLQRHISRMEKNVSDKTYFLFYVKFESVIKSGSSHLRFQCASFHASSGGGGENKLTASDSPLKTIKLLFEIFFCSMRICREGIFLNGSRSIFKYLQLDLRRTFLEYRL